MVSIKLIHEAKVIIIYLALCRRWSHLEVIEWLFSYGPPYLTLEYNIGSRRPLESTRGPCAKSHFIIFYYFGHARL